MDALTTDAVVLLNRTANIGGFQYSPQIVRATETESYVRYLYDCLLDIVRATSEFDIPVRTIRLNRIAFEKATLTVNEPLSLRVDIFYEDGQFSAVDSLFGVYGYGSSLEEAICDFYGSFLDYYEEIVNCPEEELGESTLRVRRALLDLATLSVDE